ALSQPQRKRGAMDRPDLRSNGASPRPYQDRPRPSPRLVNIGSLASSYFGALCEFDSATPTLTECAIFTLAHSGTTATPLVPGFSSAAAARWPLLVISVFSSSCTSTFPLVHLNVGKGRKSATGQSVGGSAVQRGDCRTRSVKPARGVPHLGWT